MEPTNQKPPTYLSRQVTQSKRFYFDQNPPASISLACVCGGWELCSPDYRVDRHGFPFLCLEFVAGGEGHLALNEEEKDLHRGVAFSYGPGVYHRISTTPKKPLSKYFIDFVGKEAMAKLKECGMEPGTCITVGDPARIETAFQNLIQAGVNPGPNQAKMVALHLEILLLEMIQTHLSAPGQGRSYQTFLRCRDHIDNHFMEIDSAEEIATACQISPPHLSRLFSKHGQETPYNYLLHKKMSRAADLLDYHGMLVSDVAEIFGMDAFHFSRMFKRLFRVSPSEFLRRRKGKAQ